MSRKKDPAVLVGMVCCALTILGMAALLYFAYTYRLDNPPIFNSYRVEVFRPDGTLHEARILKRRVKPSVHQFWNGQTGVWAWDEGGDHTIAPTGWAIRVSE